MFSKAQKKKKKWSLADFLHMDSKNASENDGEVRFALILANKLRRNFLCPKLLFFGFFDA